MCWLKLEVDEKKKKIFLVSSEAHPRISSPVEVECVPALKIEAIHGLRNGNNKNEECVDLVRWALGVCV